MKNSSKTPERLLEHLILVFRQEFSTFGWRKFWNDLLFGCLIAVIPLLIGIWYRMSVAQDWDEHPVVVLLVALFPLCVVVVDVSARLWRALRRVYFERSDAFREVIQTAITVGVSGVFFMTACWYISSPHPKLVIFSSAIGEDLTRGKVSVAVQVKLSNEGCGTTFRNWLMTVKLASGEIARSNELIDIPHTKLVDHTGVVVPTGNWIIGNRNTSESHWIGKGDGEIHGTIGFLFAGYRRDVIDTPGNFVFITFQDKNGKSYESKKYVIPAKFDAF